MNFFESVGSVIANGLRAGGYIAEGNVTDIAHTIDDFLKLIPEFEIRGLQKIYSLGALKERRERTRMMKFKPEIKEEGDWTFRYPEKQGLYWVCAWNLPMRLLNFSRMENFRLVADVDGSTWGEPDWREVGAAFCGPVPQPPKALPQDELSRSRSTILGL